MGPCRNSNSCVFCHGEYLEVGDKVKVHLLEVKDDGKMRLTRKPFVDEEEAQES